MKGMMNRATTTVSRLAWPVLLVLVLALAASLAGCASSTAGSDEQESLNAELVTAQAELATAQAELATAQAERDAARAELAAANEAAETRRAKSQASMEAVVKVIADPAAYGTEEEVLDELMTHVAPGAQMTDDVFGAVPMRQAWRNTIFGGVDATITTWHRWMSEDGSMGGALWTWAGTNLVGEPFELIGISINTYDEEGLQTGQLVVYPYEDSYVEKAFLGQ